MTPHSFIGYHDEQGPEPKRLWNEQPQPYVRLLLALVVLAAGARFSGLALSTTGSGWHLAIALNQIFLVMLSATCFALTWNARFARISGRIDVTGMVMLVAALLYTLGAVTANIDSSALGTQKSAKSFEVAARLLSTLTFVWLATKTSFPGLRHLTRRRTLVAIVFGFVALAAIAAIRPPWLTAIDKYIAQFIGPNFYYVLGLISLAAAWLIYRRFQGFTAAIRLQLASAAALNALACALFANGGDDILFFLTLAGLCAVLSCYFVYRAIATGCLEYPNQKIAELHRELQISEQNWREAINAGEHLIFEWLLPVDSIRINGEHANTLGLPETDLRERGSNALLASTHPLDLDRMSALLEAARTGESNDIRTSFRLVSSAPAQRWLELRVVRVNRAPRPASSMLGSLTDVSKSQQEFSQTAESQAMLNGIIDSAMDAIITVDASFKIVQFNRAAELIFGCTSAQVLGGPLDRFLPQQFRTTHNAQIARFGATGTSQRRMGASILPAVRADGQEFPISATISQVQVNGQTLFSVIIRDVSRQVESERALRNSQRQLEDHSRRAQQALEDERRRIARELHDDLGQSLTAMRMELGLTRQAISHATPELTEHCERMDKIVSAMVASTRRIAADLRPLVLDDLGLGAAIDWLVEQFSAQHRIATDAFVDEQVSVLDEPLASAVFRIVQESLTNIARHARAKAAEIRVEMHNDQVMISVWDDGVGFDVTSIEQMRTFGLRGMRERAQLLGGEFSVLSRIGDGTTIRVSLPRPRADNKLQEHT